jgi:hypothetical protein
MKKKNSDEKRNPYRSIGFGKITAPMPENQKGGGKSYIAKSDLRMRGKR